MYTTSTDLFNLRYKNIAPVANMYQSNISSIQKGFDKPKRTQFKTVNQLLRECPLVGATKYGLNFIA
ncbi:MAG: hypothetical protein PHX18_01515 [Candidatus Gastranaerophilales bacterium]|nr:hypothetical protein [Candidatus Gastranaerophilales bacterium]